MNKKTKILISMGIVLILIVGYWLFTRKSSPEDDSKRIHYKIVVMIPETGNLAFVGQPIKNALNLAAEDMQPKLAKAGITIDMVFADTKANPREAVTQFNRMVDGENVNGIVTTLSGVIAAINPMAKNKDILFVCITPDPSFLQENPRGLRVFCSLGGMKLAQVIKDRGYKRVLVLHGTDAAAMYDVSKVLVPQLEAAGITLGIGTLDIGQRDFKMLSAKYAKDRWDCLVIHAFGTEQPFIAEACANYPNLKGLPILLSLGALDVKPELRARLAGGQFFAPAFLENNSTEFTDFSKRFTEHYPGMAIGHAAIYAYDAYVLFAQALLQRRSVGALALKEELRKPTKALTQKYMFDAVGDFQPDTILMEITSDGKFAPIRR